MAPLPDDDMTRLEANLKAIRERIRAACAGTDRGQDEVSLVAVTKYAGVGYARALLELGQRDLGENRVAHLLELDAGLGGAPARWHMIGHLQRNKARKVAGVLYGLHSLDSLALARRLAEARSPQQAPLQVWAQVKLGEGPGRSGVEPAELPGLLEAVCGLTRLEVVGLMGLPPVGPAESARPYFTTLRGLARDARLESLSMGMTADLEVAIEEGATVVRVGRALLEGLSERALQS